MNRFSIEDGPPHQYEIDSILKSLDDREALYRFLKNVFIVWAGIAFLLQIFGLHIIPFWWILPLLLTAIVVWCSKSGLEMKRDFEPLDDQGEFELKAIMAKSPIVTKYVNVAMREDENGEENEYRKITWGELDMLKTAAYQQSLNPSEETDTYFWD